MPKCMYLDPTRVDDTVVVSNEMDTRFLMTCDNYLRIEHTALPGVVVFVEENSDAVILRRILSGMLIELGRNLSRVVERVQTVEVEGEEME